jgi:hypothetical protein
MSKSFEELISKANQKTLKKVSVSNAQDEPVLQAVKAAKEQNIATAILVGDEAKIREIAASIDMDLTDFEIINEPDTEAAALKAVELVHNGKADILLKGLLETKTFLKSVLNKEVGLLKGNTHSGKNNGEFFISRAYLRLPCYLSGKLCVRKTRSRKDGKLLTSYKGVKSVYRGNARLYKFLRISSRRRIHRHTVYIHSFFGDYFGAAVYGPAESVKYSAEHILGNSEFHHSAEETHLTV